MAGERPREQFFFFDLIGLSPSRQELDVFLAETRPDAYERLPSAPHYGERWSPDGSHGGKTGARYAATIAPLLLSSARRLEGGAMSMRHIHRLLFLALVLAWLGAARPVTDISADEPPPESPTPLPKFTVTEGPPAVPRQPGRDGYGDPLPKGASTRIGTLRLRHQGEARSVAFSPDGKLLATGGNDAVVRLWDTATGEQQRCLRGHLRHVLAVAFSSDGRLLASGGADGEVVLWDVRTGREVERLNTKGGRFSHLVFAPGDRFLAWAGSGEVVLWDLTTGRVRQHWREGHMDSCPRIAFTPDGKTLLRTTEGQIRAWDPIAGKELRQFKPPSANLLALKPVKDGRVLAAVSDRQKGEVSVWDSSNGRDVRRFERLYDAGCMIFAPDNRSVAVGGSQYSWICLCDLTTGRQRWLLDNSKPYGIRQVAFSPDGKWLTSADASGMVQLWDVVQGEERLLRGRPQGGLRCCLSGDGRTLATIECGYPLRPQTLCLWETASGRLIRRLTSKETEFTAVAFSPDGKVLAASVEVGYSDNMVLLWDAVSGKFRRRCRGPQKGKIVFLAFAPDGESLAGGQAGRIRLWSVRTGEELRRFAGSDTSMRAGAFSVDGKTLVTASEDGSLRVWDAASGREVRRLIGHGGYHVGDVAFSPDGRLLASVGGDEFISLWDARDYHRLRRLSLRSDWLSCVAFSPDSRFVAGGEAGGGFTIWDTSTGQARYQAAGHASAVVSLGFSRDGKSLASGSRDGTVLMWDFAALPPADRADQPATEKTDGLGDPLPAGALARLGSVRFRHESLIISVAFSPDGKTMATGSQGNSGTSVRLWDLATGRQLRLLRDYPSWISQVAFSPDGKLLAGASRGHVTFWDSATGERLCRIKAHRDWISHFAFSPNSKLVATADRPYNDPDKAYLIRLWDVAEGREVRRFEGHHAEVTDLTFSADGKRLASCSGRFEKEQNVLIWDMETGKLHRPLRVKGSWGLFSPDGRTLAVQEGKTIRLWDVDAEKSVGRVGTPSDHTAFLFTPDSRTLAVAEEEGVRLYRVATGEKLRTIANAEGKAAPFALRGPAAFSPDGKILATLDGSAVRLWDAGTGQMVRPFGGHRGKVTCLAFAPPADGRRPARQMLASGGSDQTVRLWETTTGREILCFDKHEKPIVLISFSPDGRTVASADKGGTIWLWASASGEGLRRLGDLPGEATSLCFAADGRHLLACAAGGAVYDWETATGKVRRRLGGREATPSRRPAVLTPNGRLLVTTRTEGAEVLRGQGTGYLEYRSVPTGRVLRTVRCPEERYDSLTFTGDGKFLAAMGYHIDHFHGHVDAAGVRLWEVARGEEVLRLEDLSTPFVFAPDGSVVACSWTPPRGAPWGIQCWDVATGRQLGRVAGHLDSITDAAFSPDGRLLATGSADGTILVWDGRPLTRHRPPPCPSTPRRLDDLWTDLAGADAARAYDALWTLVRRPEDAVPLLRDRLRSVPPPDAERIARLIADLDSTQFEIRRKAAAELEKLGELAEPAMRKALADRPPLEVRRRLEQLVENLEHAVYSAEQLRAFRAVAVLERIGNPPARRVLDGLAQGAPGARLTQEARASLARLASRGLSP